MVKRLLLRASLLTRAVLLSVRFATRVTVITWTWAFAYTNAEEVLPRLGLTALSARLKHECRPVSFRHRKLLLQCNATVIHTATP